MVVVGPTASGKTYLSIALAKACDGEIINTDSVLLYCGMDIGSAKPDPAELQAVPHHVIDVWNIDHEANVAEFQAMARTAITEVAERNRMPILVGGSSLYVRGVIDPLDFPGTDPTVRARWQERLDEEGAEAVHRVLVERDPAAAAMILPSNARRLVRALEVIELTGRPFTASLPPFESIYPELVMIGLDIPRDHLDDRIRRRVEGMWEAGFVDEVRHLTGLADTRTASRAIGYQQVLEHLSGSLTEDEAKELTIVGTRKLARRQERMMRKDPRITWLAYDDEHLLAKAQGLVAPGTTP